MPAPSEKAYLRSRGVRPRRRWGQHFLTNPRIAERMLASWALPARARLLEIGPGAGALTLPLLAAGHQVAAVERDGNLCALLRERVAAEYPQSPFTLIEGDIVDVDPIAAPLALPPRRGWYLVGNLPYAITSQILEWSVRHKRHFRWASFMLQREYAERLRAQPGRRVYGSLTVWVGFHFTVEREFRVGPSNFWPVPRVDSEIIRLRPRPRPPVRVPSEGDLRRVVRAAFGQRRKMLGGALSGGLALSRERVLRALESAGIDRRQRAETCDLAQFAALTRALAAPDDNSAIR